jgi:formamidopyrimidine-DNA glycosylase
VTQRLGKYLLSNLSDGEHTLILHFGMTGYLVFQEGETLFVAGGAESGGGERSLQTAELPEKTKGVFACSEGGRLGYVNMRLLGSIFLIRDIAAFRRAHGIGPDRRDRREEIRTGDGWLIEKAKIGGRGAFFSPEKQK